MHFSPILHRRRIFYICFEINKLHQIFLFTATALKYVSSVYETFRQFSGHDLKGLFPPGFHYISKTNDEWVINIYDSDAQILSFLYFANFIYSYSHCFIIKHSSVIGLSDGSTGQTEEISKHIWTALHSISISTAR